jgi:hypothetical protein
MSEKNEGQNFDFDFITQALGLIPIQDGEAALNPSMITDVCRDDEGAWAFSLQGGEVYLMDDAEMAELELTIRARAETAKALRKEALETDVRTQLEAHAKTVAELNAGLAQGGVIVGAPGNKRFRQQ